MGDNRGHCVEHLEKNLKLAIMTEMMGLGPKSYCVMDTHLPDFEICLLRVLKNLPSHKVCLYPPRTSLGGPFLLPPWDTIGRLICARPPPLVNWAIQANTVRMGFIIDCFVEGFLYLDDLSDEESS